MLPGYHDSLIEAPGIPDTLWKEARHPAGTHSFTLQVYDHRFILEGIPEGVLPHLDRLKMGTCDIKAAREIRVPLFKSSHPQFNSHSLTGPSYDIRFTAGDDTITFHGYFFAARYRRSTGEVEIVLAEARPDVLGNEIENALRIASNLYLQDRGVYLFHSSAVTIGDETYVFFGPHGAGKSTLALLAPPEAVVLGDDLNALMMHEGTLHVASVPFPSEVTAIRPIVREPVAALFRIVQDDALSLHPMGPGEIFSSLFGSMPVLNTLPGNLEVLKESVMALSRSVPIFKLHFPKTKEVFPWIKENLSSIPR